MTLRFKVVVDDNGQIVLPEQIMEALDVTPGMDVMFCLDDDGLRLEPAPRIDPYDSFMSRVAEKAPEPEQIDWDRMNEDRF